MFHDILEWIDVFIHYKNNQLKQSKTWDFTKGDSPWFWSKIGKFFISFLRQNWQGTCVLRYSRIKRSLYRLLKKKPQNSQKIRIFPKGILHGFDQELAIFPSPFCRQNWAGKCVSRYSKIKRRFFCPSSEKDKAIENWYFSKGDIQWFWSKTGNFSDSLFFFSKISQKKLFYDILERNDFFLFIVE